MKLIFLDMDGVLNTAEGWFHHTRAGNTTEDPNFDDMPRLDPRACSNLAYVLKEIPDTHLVIHSSWRKIMPKDQIAQMLESYGACKADRVIGITSPSLSKEAGIQEWLKTYPEVTHYAVLEDSSLDLPKDKLILVRHPYTGFTIVEAFETLDALGYDKNYPCFLF